MPDRVLATDRSVSTRPRIERTSIGPLSTEPYESPVPIPSGFGQGFFPYRANRSPFIGGTPSIPIHEGSGTGVINHGALYGTDDPYRIAADLFSRFYGTGPVEDTRDNPTIVGDAGISRGSSAGPIVIILGIVGVIGYFLYKRYAG